ncbi:hypothetical protein D7V91_12535 [bacterium 1xD42-67]|nr:hypothetical protein D7V91_12535 [bacterium 1xD42-67]
MAAPADVEQIRKASIQQWRKEAQNRLDSQQYLLAKELIEKVYAHLIGWEASDDTLHALAAEIYSCCGEPSTAMRYISRALVIKPDEPIYLTIKAEILGAQGQTQQERDLLIRALDLADVPAVRAEVLGAYARSLYSHVPIDRCRAESYAREAVQLGTHRRRQAAVFQALAQKEHQKQLQDEEKLRPCQEEQRRKEQLAQAHAERQVRWKHREQVKRRAHRSYLAAQTIFITFIMLEFVVFQFGLPAAVSILIFFVCAASVKYFHVFYSILDMGEDRFFDYYYILISPLWFDGVGVMLHIVGFPFLLFVFAISGSFSFSVLVISYVLFIGILYLVGNMALKSVKYFEK